MYRVRNCCDTQEGIVKTLTRPIGLPDPPAEGDWDLDTNEAGDADA